ncbi:MAG: 6,7-dimethyl-8-ribityllumazine synthase [Acidobacteriota bacterium]
MARTISGALSASGRRFGIVLPRFNDLFGRRLLDAAIDCLLRHGADDDGILVVRVPGVFELPFAAKLVASRPDVDAVLALGVLIRGATPHFDHIAAEVVRGLGRLNSTADVPVTFGVVTAENQEQAMERCGGKAGNRGRDAAIAAMEMVEVRRRVLEDVPARGA